MGVVVPRGGQYLPTESGLTPFLDRLTSAMDQRAEFQGNLEGYGQALRENGIPAAQPSGIFSGLFRSLGIGGDDVPTSASPAAPTTPVPPNISMGPRDIPPSPSPGLPTFAAAPATNPNGLPTRGDIAAYIAKSAQARGINPGMAIRVALSEGGLSPGRVGDNGSSFSTYQLHYGGMAPGGNSVPGLGDDFTARTGLDARDPANWKAATDFALDDAAKNGWGKFHGAAKVGIGNFDGIGGGGGAAPMPLATSEPHVDPSTQPPGAPGGAPPWQAQVRALIANPDTREAGKALWRQNVQGGGGLALPAGLSREALGQMINTPQTQKAGLALWAGAMSPKDGYTLSEGMTRFDAQNRAVASVAKGPEYQPEVVNNRLLSFDKHGGTATDATPAGLPQGYRPATPAEKQAYSVQPDAPLFFGPDGKPATFNSGVNVSVTTGADPLMAATGDRFKTSLDSAVAASKAIPAIQTARTLLGQGIISGAGASQILGLQKIAAQLGITDPSRINSTEAFRAAVGPIVLSTVKGLGAGAGISNADRDFAERMAGGNINLDAGSIARILDIQERAAHATIAQHNALSAQLQRTPSGAKAYQNVGPAMNVEDPDGGASQDMSPIGQARAAIARGLPREKALQRLQQLGIDPSGSGL